MAEQLRLAVLLIGAKPQLNKTPPFDMPNTFSRPRDPRCSQKIEECTNLVYRLHHVTADKHRILSLISAANMAPLPNQLYSLAAEISELFLLHSAAMIRAAHDIIGTDAMISGETLLMISDPFSRTPPFSLNELQAAADQILSTFRVAAATLEVAHQFCTAYIELSIRFTKDNLTNTDLSISINEAPSFRGQLALPLQESRQYLYSTVTLILDFKQLAQKIHDTLSFHLQ